MELSTAITLIRKGVPDNGKPQRWADLGAGSGLFTEALAHCLAPESTIVAIDRNQQFNALHEVNDVRIERKTADFIKDDIPGDLDGILMANALHFVEDKGMFLRKLNRSLESKGRLIVVEYDLDQANPWVPFPVSYYRLSSDFRDLFQVVEQIGHADSLYQRSGMYSAVLTFKKDEKRV